MSGAETTGPPATDQSDEGVPPGYREGFLTAITVFLGFSLAFMRFWTFETPGVWTKLEIASAGIVGLGIAFQLYALYRSLSLADHQRKHYAYTVRVFFIGVLIVLAGVVLVTPSSAQ